MGSKALPPTAPQNTPSPKGDAFGNTTYSVGPP